MAHAMRIIQIQNDCCKKNGRAGKTSRHSLTMLSEYQAAIGLAAPALATMAIELCHALSPTSGSRLFS
jgi:hypothetical protein